MNKDYIDLLRLLLKNNARFMVIGAYALAVHGHPRATGDMDVWIDTDGDNPGRVINSLKEFGAPLGGLTTGELAIPGTVYQVGVAPRRIDIITKIDGVEFNDAWPNIVEVDIKGEAIPFIGRDDFLVNKLSTGRLKDISDAEALKNQKT